jgi:hypothetical protein
MTNPGKFGSVPACPRLEAKSLKFFEYARKKSSRILPPNRGQPGTALGPRDHRLEGAGRAGLRIDSVSRFQIRTQIPARDRSPYIPALESCLSRVVSPCPKKALAFAPGSQIRLDPHSGDRARSGLICLLNAGITPEVYAVLAAFPACFRTIAGMPRIMPDPCAGNVAVLGANRRSRICRESRRSRKQAESSLARTIAERGTSEIMLDRRSPERSSDYESAAIQPKTSLFRSLATLTTGQGRQPKSARPMPVNHG